MYIGLVQVIQIAVCIVVYFLIIRWIQKQRCCPYCRFTYESYINAVDFNIVGRAEEVIASYCDYEIEADMYIYYLWTWINFNMGTEQGLCREIKSCPVCGRKLR